MPVPGAVPRSPEARPPRSAVPAEKRDERRGLYSFLLQVPQTDPIFDSMRKTLTAQGVPYRKYRRRLGLVELRVPLAYYRESLLLLLDDPGLYSYSAEDVKWLISDPAFRERDK